jgi:hypothetical protein
LLSCSLLPLGLASKVESHVTRYTPASRRLRHSYVQKVTLQLMYVAAALDRPALPPCLCHQTDPCLEHVVISYEHINHMLLCVWLMAHVWPMCETLDGPAFPPGPCRQTAPTSSACTRMPGPPCLPRWPPVCHLGLHNSKHRPQLLAWQCRS